MSLVTIAAYQFILLDQLPAKRSALKQFCLSLGLKGTLLLAPEGINCFMAGEQEKIIQFKEMLEKDLGLRDLNYKEHFCDTVPFTRLLVKIKKEIISIGDPDLFFQEKTAPYIEPRVFKKWLDENREMIVLDTRNQYEIECGTFKNAVHLGIDTFRQITTAAHRLPSEYKDKTMVMFCTGGIRCEKASAYFIKIGFKKVFQLQGGILKYFEDCQSDHYEGHCFVFDWRLSVDSQFKSHERTLESPINSGRHILEES